MVFNKYFLEAEMQAHSAKAVFKSTFIDSSKGIRQSILFTCNWANYKVDCYEEQGPVHVRNTP